jgi:hypothetical protein
MQSFGSVVAWRPEGEARCTNVSLLTTGSRWTTLPAPCAAYGKVATAPVAALSASSPVLAWVERAAGGGDGLLHTAQWSGTGWLPLGPGVAVTSEEVLLVAPLAYSPGPIRVRPEPGGGLRVERWAAGWTALPSVGSAGAQAKQLLASGSDLHLLWQEAGEAPGSYLLHAARLRPGAAAWDEIAGVEFASEDPSRPAALAIDRSGRPVVTWLEGSAATPALRTRWVNAVP